MSPPADIPGFFYDKVKKKYFKIQASSAGPSGSLYTSSAIQRRGQAEDAIRNEETQIQAQKNLVTRAPILDKSLLTRLTLEREGGCGTGTSSNSCVKAIHTYVSGWSVTEILQEASASSYSIPDFAYDAVGRVLYYPIYHRAGLVASREFMGYSKFRYSRNSNRHNEAKMLLCGGGVDFAAISIHPSSRILLATWQEYSNPTSPFIHVAPILDPPQPGPYGYPDDFDFIDTSQKFELRQQSGTRGSDLEIFATAAAKSHSPYLFAICSNQGIHVIDEAVNLSRPYRNTKSHTLAVEFIDSQPSLLMAGQRNGAIGAIDDRTGSAKYNRIISHPSAVRHIKQINCNSIVVAGLHSTLCNYDLRYCKERAAQNYTTPVTEYLSYENDAHLDFGFDVDSEAGLVAAVVQKPVTIARKQGGHCVKIFSSLTGELIRTLDLKTEGATQDLWRSKAVRFVSDRGDGLPKTLWIANGSKITGYGW